MGLNPSPVNNKRLSAYSLVLVLQIAQLMGNVVLVLNVMHCHSQGTTRGTKDEVHEVAHSVDMVFLILGNPAGRQRFEVRFLRECFVYISPCRSVNEGRRKEQILFGMSPHTK
jgi:hypothetical protein